MGQPTLTKENRVVRTFKVGDPTACINVSVWDEPGNVLVPGDIVRLTKGYASIWRHCLTLYSGKNGEILKIGEFCMNFNELINMSEPNPTLTQIPAMNQPNAGMLLNNGTVSNNGNIPALQVTPSIGPPTTGSTPSSGPSQTKPSSGRATSEQTKSNTNSKSNVRGGRNNQAKAKGDRR